MMTQGAELLAFTISRLMGDSNLLSEGHWSRVVRYVRALADAAPVEGEYIHLKDPNYLAFLTAVAPLYDLGQLAVPRNVLMKPDRLEPDERNLLQTHTTQGAEVLEAVAAQFGPAQPSLQIAVEVARSHHERWDGLGYPDRLAGNAIPLSARVVGIVAAYEAMRSRRPHRPPLSHARTLRILTTECGSQFDPQLLAAFQRAADQFDRIHQGL